MGESQIPKESEEAMSIFKRGDVYWYKFMWNGRSIRESAKTGNDKTARKLEAAHKTRLAEGLVGIREKKSVPTFKAFCTERIEPYAKALSSTKWTWYRAGTRALLKYAPLANMPLDEIRGEHAAGFSAWRTGQEITPGAINSNLRVLRRVLRLAADWGVIDVAPKLQLLPGEGRRERVITPDEEQTYLAKCAPFLREVFTVLIDTGLRPDELHRMQWQEISWPTAGKRGSILVLTGKTSAARRLIPMTPRVLATLADRWELQGKPAQGWVWPSETKTGHIDHSTTKKQHCKALKDAKVAPFVLYSLRHTFLTRLGASGCDVWTLMRIAGHSSIAISSRYVHPHADTIDRAFAALTGETVPEGGHKTGHSRKPRALQQKREVGGNPHKHSVEMVSAAGFEPATHALKGHCSTN
jgi:integrase